MNAAEAGDVVAESLRASGLVGRGSVFRLRGSDVQWLVQIDRLPFGKRLGIDIGLDLEIDSTPRLPTDCSILLHLENLQPFDGSMMVEALDLDPRLDDRAAIVAALDLASNLDGSDRRDVLETAAQTLGGYVTERPTLASVRDAHRAGEFDSGFIHREARAVLENDAPTA
jgi:hypothetical protein